MKDNREMLGKGLMAVAGAAIGWGVMSFFGNKEREYHDKEHKKVVLNFNTRIEDAVLVLAQLQVEIDTLNSQRSEQTNQIYILEDQKVRMEALCRKTREEFDLTQNNHADIKAKLEKLEGSIKHAEVHNPKPSYKG